MKNRKYPLKGIDRRPILHLILAVATASNLANSGDRKLRILLADDQFLIRKTVRTVLEGYSRFEVCGEAADGATAIEEALRLKPDVIILNVSMPILNGFEAAREIKSKRPESAIVILSSHADKHFIEEGKRAGARAYVDKTKIGEALIKAIRDAVESEDFVLVC